MGTEFVRCIGKEEEMDFPAIPPGFESFTSFTLKKVEDSERMPSCSASTSASESHPTQMEIEYDTGVVGMKKSRRHRPSVNYNQFDYSSGEESDSGKLGKIQKVSSKSCLPKGVIRGCTDCRYCQKVSARWRPEDSCKPDLKDAPVFYPTEQEFEDTIKYIASIRPTAELYGICRIVPPPSWKPPCPLKQKSIWEGSKFATRVQRIDKLQNRDPMRDIARSHNHMRTKKRKCMGGGIECENDGEKLLVSGEAEFLERDYFGFEPGPEFTLNSFQKYAEEFRCQYFRKDEISCLGGSASHCDRLAEPSVEHIEGEYWRVVEKPTEEIEVLYGADLETGSFGSGFPKMSSQNCYVSTDKYIKSGWNLNNFPKLPGSVLSYESGDISGVLVPWLYIGMCFSSFCWHVEDHHLYSLNYMHWGAPKVWYGVPASDALKLEATMRKKMPELFEEQPDLLHKLVTQLSPTILKSEGVPVYRCVQNSGEFVLTFPRAYHSGFNCGFNCAEAVNVAPVDWLPLGQHAVELYREQHRKTSISHDKLLLGAAREGVRALWELNFLKKYSSSNLRWKDACGKNGILAAAFKTRVEIEHTRREFLCNSLKTLKMETDFDANTERECSICYFDLHLSAVGCRCSPDSYACLNHAKQFCNCALEEKIFIYRYDLNDLKILVEALEGKLSAIYRWARQDLQLSLSSYVIRENMPSPGIVAKSSSSPKATLQKEMASPLSKESVNEIKVKAESMEISVGSSGSTCESTSLQGEKGSEALLASDSSTALPASCIASHKIGISDLSTPCKKNQSVCRAPNIASTCQLSQDGTSSADISISGDSKEKKCSLAYHSIAIHFSDHRCKKPEKPTSDGLKATHAIYPDIPERLIESDDKVTLCNYEKEIILTTPVSTAIAMGEEGASLLPDGKMGSSPSRSLCQKYEDQQLRGAVQGSFVASISCNIGSNTGSLRSHEDSLVHRGNNQSAVGNHDSQLQDIRFCGNKRTNNEDKRGIMLPSNNSNLIDNVWSIPRGPVSGQNYLERNLNQKGPRVAKVVRRINCNIEPLDYGTVLSGKAWCNRQAIFPKGYRSRVRYISILDPTSMCYYISEILDGGWVGPLFMVSVEDCPNEIFVHVTAGRCWDMVRERVNYEISRHHKLGTPKLPPLQPPGSLDGIEMFGFSSPVIIKEIMAMDRDRVCTEYWSSRPYSKFQVQLPGNSVAKDCGSQPNPLSTKSNNQGACDNRESAVDIEQVLIGLLKKANPEELLALRSLLNEDRAATGTDLLDLVTEEMNRPR